MRITTLAALLIATIGCASPAWQGMPDADRDAWGRCWRTVVQKRCGDDPTIGGAAGLIATGCGVELRDDYERSSNRSEWLRRHGCSAEMTR